MEVMAGQQQRCLTFKAARRWHPGQGPGLTFRRLGERGGTQFVTLSEDQMPNHTPYFAGQ